jgi:hypothetical protein
MKTIATVLASVALMLAAAAPCHASDQTRFAALVRKYVPDYGDQFISFAPKTTCICEPGVSNRAGVVLQDFGFVSCVVPNFVNGSLATFSSSCASYVVLGR